MRVRLRSVRRFRLQCLPQPPTARHSPRHGGEKGESMSALLWPTFLADLEKVYAALRPPPLSEAFLSDLEKVHDALPALSNAHLLRLANHFDKWRTRTKELRANRLAELEVRRPLEVPNQSVPHDGLRALRNRTHASAGLATGPRQGTRLWHDASGRTVTPHGRHGTLRRAGECARCKRGHDRRVQSNGQAGRTRGRDVGRKRTKAAGCWSSRRRSMPGNPRGNSSNMTSGSIRTREGEKRIAFS